MAQPQDLMKQLVAVNPLVSILPPEVEAHGDAAAIGPSIILLFGWRDGKMAHIMKYAAGLRELYPAAHIIIHRTVLSYYFTSNEVRVQTLSPVAEYIQNTVKTAGDSFRGVLVYVLSSGGGVQLMALRKLLRNSKSVLKHNAPTALVLDSSPGASGLSEAVTSGAPVNPLLRMVAIPPISLLYFIFYLLNAARGNQPLSYELRTSLNSTRADDKNLPVDLLPPLLPSVTPEDPVETPRLYIYSRADIVTPYPLLEAHIAEARQKGFDVTVERFEKTAHVSHMRSDPERYWGAIKTLWSEAVRGRTRDRSRL